MKLYPCSKIRSNFNPFSLAGSAPLHTSGSGHKGGTHFSKYLSAFKAFARRLVEFRQKAAEIPGVKFASRTFYFIFLVHAIQTYIVDVTMCIGPSMLPTFREAGDIVLINRLGFRFRGVDSGDVVIANSPTNEKQTVCKRVRGLPGDVVKYKRPRGGKRSFPWSRDGTTVPEGHVWLQGDNESNSTDSRHYGPVPMELITGTVTAKIWPLTGLKFF